jgi:IS5 family transposase
VPYGRKLNLVTGKSGLILDVVVEDGNPADTERFLPMLDRQIARRGAPPRQTAADGGYASRDNLKQAKARGVHDVAFHKKCGIAVADMVRSPWVYRRLRNFRAGIEAGISCFRRAYGGARCTWRGLDHFKAYIWSAVVAHNLMLFAPAGSGGRLVGLSGLTRNAIPSLIVTTETRKRAANAAPATSAAVLHC